MEAPTVKAPTGQTPSGITGYLPLLALALLALIWGYNWVVMKQGLRYSQPFTFASLRNFLSAIGLFALLPQADRRSVKQGVLITCGQRLNNVLTQLERGQYEPVVVKPEVGGLAGGSSP